MKKYFIKSVAIFLFAAVFVMASGFCFNSPLSSVVKMKVAKASLCDEAMPVQTSDHHNSILPCCSDSGHPTFNILSQFQSLEISKFIPSLFFNENQILKPVLKKTVYFDKIIAPPELVFLESTILRI